MLHHLAPLSSLLLINSGEKGECLVFLYMRINVLLFFGATIMLQLLCLLEYKEAKKLLQIGSCVPTWKGAAESVLFIAPTVIIS